MGLDRAKSLLEVRDGLSFLDITVRQVLAARKRYGVRLPLVFMDSFRTQADTAEALAKYPELAVDGLPISLLQGQVPKLRADDLTPVMAPARARQRIREHLGHGTAPLSVDPLQRAPRWRGPLGIIVAILLIAAAAWYLMSR